MTTLVSPGVSVTITDETIGATSAAGTVPLIFIATQSNKQLPDGSGGIAPGTLAANAGKVYSITSQRELLQTFGNPYFRTVDGTVQQGDEVNEYGLHAAYSYLGIANQAIIVRADLNTAQLIPTETEPTSVPTNGTYWFDTADTAFGVFVANGNSNAGLAWNKASVLVPTMAQTTGTPNYVPLGTYGSAGNIAVSVWNTNNAIYQKVGTAWYQIGSAAWKAALGPTVLTGTVGFAAASSVPGTAGTLVIDGVSISILNTDTLTAIVAAVGTNVPNVTASVYNSGSGSTPYYLRLTDAIGADIVIGSGSTAGLLTALGLTATTTSGYHLSYSAHTSVPAGTHAGDIWIKTTTANYGSNYVVKLYSTSLSAFQTKSTPFYTDDIYAEEGLGLTIGNLYVQYNTTGTLANPISTQVIKRLGSSLSVTATSTAFATPSADDTFSIRTRGSYGTGLGTDVTISVSVVAPITGATSAATSSGNTLTFTTTPAGIIAGMLVTDSTTPGVIPAGTLVVSTTGTTVVMSNAVTGAGVGNGDTMSFAMTAQNVADAINTSVAANGYVPHIVASVVSSQLQIASTNGSAFLTIDGANTSLADMTVPVGYQTNWTILTYEASATTPTTVAAEGTLWFNPALTVDIMVNDGNEWIGYRNYYTATDPNGPQLTSAEPTTQSNGNSLVENDLWIDTSNTTGYPAIYRYLSGVWTLVDNTDQTTPMGVVFGDARKDSGPTGAWLGTKTSPLTGTAAAESDLPADLIHSNWMDPVELDELNPEIFPAGIMLFNTEIGTNNVKVRRNTYFTGVTTYTVGEFLSDTYETAHPGSQAAAAAYLSADPARWVTFSGNDDNGVAYMGSFAQRQCVVRAMAAQIVGNEDLLSEALYFNLIAAPGYVELYSNLETLNVERNETAFIVTDTPMSLTPDATSVQNWATNTANVVNNGRLGRITEYTYAAMYYPGCGMGTNIDGSAVAIPSSTIALATYGYNDRVAYPWYPAAGSRRGIVSNASSVGYVDISTHEYKAVVLNQGQRDTLYTNDINPIAFIPGQGLEVYGNKTMCPTIGSLQSRINVARLTVYIRWMLPQLVQQFLFELNTAQVQSAAEDVVTKFMTGLIGKNAISDFAVMCSSVNNTPETMAANELWIDVAFVPVEAIEFIYVPVRIVTSLN